MNRFGTRLVGASAIPPPPPPKSRSNENLDKIDMSLGEEPSWVELEWGEGCRWDQVTRFVGEGSVSAVVSQGFCCCFEGGRNQMGAFGDLGSAR